MSSSDGKSSASGGFASAEEGSDMSSAGSTSTQWPSAPSSPQTNDMRELQNILDHALNDPFSTHPSIVSHLKSNIETHCRQAARKILEADVLIAVTGAGFSADSGLATYDCVANIDAYRSRGWRYRDLCTPLAYTDFSTLDQEGGKENCDESNSDAMEIEKTTGTQVDIDVSNTDDGSSNNDNKEKYNDHARDNNLDENSLQGSFNNANAKSNNSDSDSDSEVPFNRSVLPEFDDMNHPQWFYGFWGQCYNDYRRVGPHDGYDIIARWARHKNYVPKQQQQHVEGSESIEGKEESIVAKQIRSITDKLEKGDDDNNSCCSGENDEPYYVSDERAGAFYLFTSNVDAHSFDVFESHEIRECHGNVELWQCHNFACGTNDSSMQNGHDESCIEGDKPMQKGWERRLWRLPDDHQFTVCQETMAAPYSIQSEEAKVAAAAAEPAPKRQKSISELDKMDDDDTANAIGAMMANTVQRHLESGGDEAAVTSSDDLPPAHIGDVHGKPRLFPLKHMQPPSGQQRTQPESYYLPITSNWPKCPRCNEAARPAVLMFEDLDWVYNKPQERRWKNWCQSLLKICKHRARGGNGDMLSFSSTSTVENGSDMSENGWENVFDEDRVDEAGSPEDRTSRVPRASPPLAFAGDDDNSLQSEESQENGTAIENSQESTSSRPLKVCILEIGCGYNVPTCRAISESIVSRLNSHGGDATLVRINPAHPEADDPSVEDNIISIMEKGLASLKFIDDEYSKLLNQES
jgi:NAD-dependent SIR2 family protein deacetylase